MCCQLQNDSALDTVLCTISFLLLFTMYNRNNGSLSHTCNNFGGVDMAMTYMYMYKGRLKAIRMFNQLVYLPHK